MAFGSGAAAPGMRSFQGKSLRYAMMGNVLVMKSQRMVELAGGLTSSSTGRCCHPARGSIVGRRSELILYP